MIKGTLLLESLRDDASLTGFRFVVQDLGRERPELSPEQIAAGMPDVWCIVDFELEEDRGSELADTLSKMLKPGWYANFSGRLETFVVYEGRVFRYPRGDPVRRAEAQSYGPAHGVPDRQLNWRE